MLAQAVGPALRFHLVELLDLMLATGLSESLCQTLTDLATCIPHSLPGIQGKSLHSQEILHLLNVINRHH